LALKERTVSGHAAKEAVAKFFDNIPRRIGKWLARVMNHDLRSGTKISLITAAMGENVWEDNAVTSKDGEVSRYFGCSLAHHYASWPKGWEYALVEPKLDGWRVVAHVGQKSVTFYTRNGKHEPHTSNLQHVAKQLLELGFRNCVVDGEIVIGGQWNATALMRHKNPTDEVKTVLRDKAVFHVFDYFGLDSSLTSIPEPNMAFSERRKVLYKHLKEGSKNVKLVKQWKVTGPVGVQKAYKLVLKRGYEGLMIKDPTAPYAFKRGRSILKLKPEREIDVYVVGCKLGSGKHAHRLGTLLCKKADGVEVRVGSGWSDKEREELWRKRKTLIGKWLEAKETDPMQKAIKFNHPRFIRWRPELDKN
jgi:ATP-dependent DNA ligase